MVEETKELGCGYNGLANAIVMQAVKDYKVWARQTHCNKNTARYIELDHFFHSEYFTLLTKCDGDYIWKELEKHYGKKTLQ